MNLNGAGIINYYYLVQGKNAKDGVINGNGLDFQGYHRIRIPFYQRPYRWGKGENISHLFEDYNENKEVNDQDKSAYFVGATVAINKTEMFDIVDGQQRLTTIFLMNYILYIICRDRLEYMIKSFSSPSKWGGEIEMLKDIYADRIGRNNTKLFDDLKEKFDKTLDNQMNGKIGIDEAKAQCLKSFRDALGCVSKSFDSEQDLLKEYQKQTKLFLNKEDLTLCYSREAYNQNLKDVLSLIKLSYSDNPLSIDIQIIGEKDIKETDYRDTYCKAVKIIFEFVKEQANNSASLDDYFGKMSSYLKDILLNLNICMITTDKEEDANRLFEVLNDRALEVADLELVKNHFYEVFCENNKDEDPRVIDNNIDELDKIWSEKVFNDNAAKKNRQIAYFATVYLAQDKKLDNKNEAKFKDSLKNNYTKKLESYSLEKATHDFNIFYAVKILLENFNVVYKNQEINALKAIADPNKSRVYKTFWLLLSLNSREAINASLINVILAVYEKSHNEFDIEAFKTFATSLMSKDFKTDEADQINKMAFILWNTNLLAKDYKKPRLVAADLIENYGHQKKNITFVPGYDINSYVEEFKKTILNWSYDGNKNFIVKILMLELFTHKKEKNILRSDYFVYSMNPEYINLDHLEPSEFVKANPKAYYEPQDELKRQRMVNSIGNMMILDRNPNIKKSNDPMFVGITNQYDKYKGHWMLTEIDEMHKDPKYFNGDIPKDEFFNERGNRLFLYFKALLTSSYNCTDITIV